MPKEGQPLSLDMFLDPSRRDGAMLETLYTPGSLELMRSAVKGNGGRKPRINYAGVDKGFGDRVHNIYGLNGHYDSPHSFYEQQRGVANGVMAYVPETAFPRRYRERIKNELQVLYDTPSERLKMLADPTVDDKLKFEAVRQMVLAHASALLNARSLNGTLNRRVGLLHQHIGEQIYSGKRGRTYERRFASYHDPDTNTVLGVGEVSDVASSPVVTKQHSREARHITGLGFVYTNMRLKNEAVATVKSLYKAPDAGGFVNPDAVQDSAGIMYTALGDRPMVDKLVDRVAQAVEAYPDTVNVVEDHQTGNDHGQNNGVEFQRLQVHLKDTPVPIELMFYALPDYLNSVYEVGERDPQTGHYTGQAHDLFAIRRVARVLPFLYPKYIYKKLDYGAAVRERMEEVAQDLREDSTVKAPSRRNGVAYPTPLAVPRILVS